MVRTIAAAKHRFTAQTHGHVLIALMTCITFCCPPPLQFDDNTLSKSMLHLTPT